MSDLNRLLQELPSEYFDDGRMARGSQVLKFVGGAMLGVGVVLAASMAMAGEREAIAGALGPLIAGGTNLTLGLAFGRKAKASAAVGLTEDARHMLLALMLERVPQRRYTMGPGHGRRFGARPLVVIPAPVEADLEKLASAYLALTGAAKSSDIRATSHSVHARMAAQEALTEGLNAAAAAIRHPEADYAKALSSLAERMNEAAVRLVPSEASVGSLDSLLSNLREEERARQELNH